MTTNNDLLVEVDGASKKFCRSLKKSLWYGVADIGRELAPFGKNGADSSELASHLANLRPDEFWAVNNVSFKLRRGECIGLIGHNGAGKTTLLKMLNGLIKPDQGRITMRGRVGALIALGAGFNPILSGRENIYVNASILGIKKNETADKIDEIIDFAEIREFIDAPVQSYSSGMAVRLGFAIASSFKPDVMLLDEVLAVGDMGFQAKCFNRLGELRREGASFILVAHNMHHITRFCDNVVFMRSGSIVFAGSTDRGVELYLNAMAESNSQETGIHSLSGIEQLPKSPVELIDVSLFDANGHRVAEIKTGEELNIKFLYKVGCTDIHDPVVEIAFRNSSGDPWFHSSTRIQGVSVGNLGGAGCLTICFPSFPANNQVLTLSIAIWDNALTELLYWCRGVRIRVSGNASSLGSVVVPCIWSKSSEAKN